MGFCEDCMYYILGTCLDGEKGCEATCFVSCYEEDQDGIKMNRAGILFGVTNNLNILRTTLMSVSNKKSTSKVRIQEEE